MFENEEEKKIFLNRTEELHAQIVNEEIDRYTERLIASMKVASQNSPGVIPYSESSIRGQADHAKFIARINFALKLNSLVNELESEKTMVKKNH